MIILLLLYKVVVSLQGCILSMQTSAMKEAFAKPLLWQSPISYFIWRRKVFLAQVLIPLATLWKQMCKELSDSWKLSETLRRSL